MRSVWPGVKTTRGQVQAKAAVALRLSQGEEPAHFYSSNRGSSHCQDLAPCPTLCYTSKFYPLPFCFDAPSHWVPKNGSLRMAVERLKSLWIVVYFSNEACIFVLPPELYLMEISSIANNHD